MTKLILSIALFSNLAFASDFIDYLQTLSWDQLRSEEALVLSGDKIWFGGSQFSVLDVCLSANLIRTIHKQNIEIYDGQHFRPAGTDYLYTNLVRMRPVVSGESTVSRPEIVPLTYNIKINVNGGKFSDRFLFDRPYTIANCP